MKRKGRLLLVLGIVFLVLAGGIAWSQVTERVSVDTTGSDADSASTNPSTSSNGSYVAFQSDATDLVAGGSNGSMHIFVRDRQTGGNETLDPSRAPSISGDGMQVAFESDANLDLVAGDTNAFSDIFVRDLLAVTTTLVSVDSTGVQDLGPSVSPSVSSDGRYVAFQSEADLVLPDNGFIDIFVHDRDDDEDGNYDEAGSISTVRVSVDSAGSQGNNHSYFPSISSDGRYVAFESIADNLVAGDTPFLLGGFRDVFVHDRQTGVTTRVSVDSAGTEGNADSGAPSISADGRYVAFESKATNLVPGGSNGSIHIFVHDRDADDDGIYDDEDGTYHPGEVSTVQVSVDSAGSEGDADSRAPSISADGRYVAFQSDADNLVASDNGLYSDVFVHDLQTRTTTRVSVDSVGTEGNDISWDPSISANGKYVAFESDADNLVAGDAPPPIGFRDIFVYERESLLPTVDLTSPVDGSTNAAVGAGITATFSEPMQASTINTNTFTIDNGVTGTVSYDANSTTATFTPTSNLNYDTTYTATITTGAEDLAGNGLLANYTWSFTTWSEGNSGGNSGCFIATAASGSGMAGEVK
jgi:Tol biopolymer transport system component